MSLESALKIVAAIVAVCGIAFSFFQHQTLQRFRAETPYLESKLKSCEAAVASASAIAAAPRADHPDIDRFWALYWGGMRLVEGVEITSAMQAFGAALDSGDFTRPGAGRTETRLRAASLALADACKGELDREWSIRWGN